MNPLAVRSLDQMLRGFQNNQSTRAVTASSQTNMVMVHSPRVNEPRSNKHQAALLNLFIQKKESELPVGSQTIISSHKSSKKVSQPVSPRKTTGVHSRHGSNSTLVLATSSTPFHPTGTNAKGSETQSPCPNSRK